jgi:hypothetical protein
MKILMLFILLSVQNVFCQIKTCSECKRVAVYVDGKCYMHSSKSNVKQCNGITKKNQRCKMRSKKDYCRLHEKKN